MNKDMNSSFYDGLTSRPSMPYTDAELMENRRKLILSINAHKMRSHVRKDRIIPRRMKTRSSTYTNDESTYGRYDYSWDSSMWTKTPSPDHGKVSRKETAVSFLVTEDDDEGTHWRVVSRGVELTEREDPTKIVYLTICKRLDIRPLAKIETGLSEGILQVKHTMIGSGGIQACAVALVNNTTVTELCMHNTDCGDKGAQKFGEMISANTYITSLTLSECFITVWGLSALVKGLNRNTYIDHLDLSGNQLCDKAAVILGEYLQKHMFLEHLDLSHNKIAVIGAEALGKAIGVNTMLEYVDLSWNHIRLRGAVAIADGIRVNHSVVTLNLGWNGFSYDGSIAMARALSKNCTLRHLDLTNNRINLDCLVYLVKGVKANITLKTLKIGLNPLSSDGATYIIDAILRNTCLILEELDMTGQSVNNVFITKLNMLREKRPFIVHHGIIIHQEDIIMDGECFLDEDPVSVLFEYMKQNNLRLVDLFKKLDTDNNFFLSRDELKNGFLNVNIPLSGKSLDKLLDDLDLNGDKQIDLAEMMHGVKNYKKKVRLAKLRRDKEMQLLKEQGQLLDEFLNQEDDSSRVSRKIQALMTNKSLYDNQSMKNEVNQSGVQSNMAMFEDPEQAKLMEMSRKVQSLMKDNKDQLHLPGDDRRRSKSRAGNTLGPGPGLGTPTRYPSRPSTPRVGRIPKEVDVLDQADTDLPLKTDPRRARGPSSSSNRVQISSPVDGGLNPTVTLTPESGDVITASNPERYSRFARASSTLGIPAKAPKLTFAAQAGSRGRKKGKRATAISASQRKGDDKQVKLKPLLKRNVRKSTSPKK